MRLVLYIALLAVVMGSSGCAYVKRGSLENVTPTTENQRVGNVFLVRGWIGIFSTGMDSLGEKIREEGIAAEVYQGEQTRQLARAIAEAYADRTDAEPLVLIGHSYGADNVLRIARELESTGITVDLLITFDPVTPPEVPGNIARLYNYYKPNGAWDNLPWLRGIPLQVEPEQNVRLANIDLTTDRRDLLETGTNHFNIEKNEKLHGEVLKNLQSVCLPRSTWTRRSVPNIWTQDLPSVSLPVAQLSSSRMDD